MEFERLAAASDDAVLKGQLLKQAAEYMQLAEKRAKAIGLTKRASPKAE